MKDLTKLSTDELENMILQDFESPGTYSSDLISEILQILVEREDPDPETRNQKTEKAWKDFLERFGNT